MIQAKINKITPKTAIIGAKITVNVTGINAFFQLVNIFNGCLNSLIISNKSNTSKAIGIQIAYNMDKIKRSMYKRIHSFLKLTRKQSKYINQKLEGTWIIACYTHYTNFFRFVKCEDQDSNLKLSYNNHIDVFDLVYIVKLRVPMIFNSYTGINNCII